MSEGLQKGNQLEISDPAKTKRDVFHRGCFTKSISKDLVSLQHRIKTSQPHKSHRSCHKTQIIPWPALPASLQTAMGQSLGWEGGQKSQEVSCRLGFHRMGVGRSWVNSYKPQPKHYSWDQEIVWGHGHRAETRASNFFSVYLFIYLF